MTPKIKKFIADREPTTPCLIVDLDVVVDRYRALSRLLPSANIHYAVKANPSPMVLETLAGLGSRFDAASLAEIRLCLAAGARPDGIIFGNTIKKQDDIARAHQLGISLFAFDSRPELEKLAAAAPGARVYGRLHLEDEGAGWPIGRKFGTSVPDLVALLSEARDLGLIPYGLSFHVGSQQTSVDRWELAIGKAAMVFTALEAVGIDLKMLDLGGGIPVRYRDDVPKIEACVDAIQNALVAAFGNRQPDLFIEPGRALVAEAGVILTEVVLATKRDAGSDARWVYLDVGKFGGLAESMGEAITYDIYAQGNDGPSGPVVLAGPTCDGADILYEDAGYQLPLDLAAGDRLEIHAAGAYTSSYASIGFNGFAPLQEHYL